jgi:hypothetical protein
MESKPEMVSTDTATADVATVAVFAMMYSPK